MSGVVLAGVSGCGTDVYVPAGSTGPTTPTNPGTPTLTGNWQLAATPGSGTVPFSSLTGAFVEGGAQTNGSLLISSILQAQSPSNCYTGQTTIPSQGTLTTSQALSVTSFSVGGQYLALTGTAAADRNSLANGRYQITSGCADGQSGTYIGTKIPAFTGNYTGTLATPASGLTLATSQDSFSDGQGFFHLSGTASLTSVSGSGSTPCFTSGMIQKTTSTITGRVVHLVIMSGASTIQADGLLATDATTVLLTLATVTGGGCAGTAGTGTLTRS